jgi:hypothetical protein
MPENYCDTIESTLDGILSIYREYPTRKSFENLCCMIKIEVGYLVNYKSKIQNDLKNEIREIDHFMAEFRLISQRLKKEHEKNLKYFSDERRILFNAKLACRRNLSENECVKIINSLEIIQDSVESRKRQIENCSQSQREVFIIEDFDYELSDILALLRIKYVECEY